MSEERKNLIVVIECPCGNTNNLELDDMELDDLERTQAEVLSELMCYKCYTKGSFRLKMNETNDGNPSIFPLGDLYYVEQVPSVHVKRKENLK